MPTTIEGPVDQQTGHAQKSSHAGKWLAVWTALWVVLQGAIWVGGLRGYSLKEAVEQGAEEAETQGIGEVGDEVIRKAIQTQRDTLPFWTALAILGDFVLGPLMLVTRAVVVATLFSGLALLRGRRARFEAVLGGCAAAQGFWVLGLAVRVGLMIALARPDVETSPTLLLEAGTYEAGVWVALSQLDAFALLGWLTMVRVGWTRGQSSLFGSILLCGLTWAVEATVRISAALVMGAGMRLSPIPENLG